MDVRNWQRLTAGLALAGMVVAIGIRLGRERAPRYERVTLPSLVESVVEKYPLTRSLWSRTVPARRWWAKNAPEGLTDAGAATGLALVVVSLWLAVGLLDDVMHDDVAYDFAIGNAVERSQHPWAVRSAEWLSEATSPGGTSLVTVGVVWALFRLGRRVEALGLAAAVAGTAITTGIVKETLGRPRPKGVDIYRPMGHSFPSGHTSGTAALYIYLAWMLTHHESSRARMVAALAAGALTAAVASSRVYLAVHWVSDVFAGAALGVGIASGSVLYTRSVLRQQALRVATGAAMTD